MSWLRKFFNKSDGYTSEIDDFLRELDKKPGATSINRQAEELKYQRIHYLRDFAVRTLDKNGWETF